MKSGRCYLKIPPLFKDSNHRFVDVSDQLVSFWLPQIVHAQLQLLYKGVLQSAARSGGISEKKTSFDANIFSNGYVYKMLLYGAKFTILRVRFCPGLKPNTDLSIGCVLCTSVFLHGTFLFDIRADAHKRCPAHRERRWGFRQVESNVRVSNSIDVHFPLKVTLYR